MAPCPLCGSDGNLEPFSAGLQDQINNSVEGFGGCHDCELYLYVEAWTEDQLIALGVERWNRRTLTTQSHDTEY